MKEVLENVVKDALAKLGYPEVPFVVEYPADVSHGDYSSNAALLVAGETGENPIDVADKILQQMEISEGVADINVAKPGFINFFLKRDFFAKQVAEIIKDPDYGRSNLLKGKAVIVEYTQPNILKPFHIGHLMNNTLGESISRLFEFGGADVHRANYQGDVGLHVAKALWGMEQMGAEMPAEGDSLAEKTEFLGNAYVHGASQYEENLEVKEEINELNVRITRGGDEEVRNLYETGKRWSLEHFEEIYAILGTKFDKYYFESQTAPIGERMVRDNMGEVFEESDGAIIYRGEKVGLHTRVFVNARGVPTYEAKELALPKMKFDDFSYDTSVVVTAVEQKEYFKVVMAALAEIEPDLAKKTRHVTHGMMQLSGEKMSSRKGNVVTGESLLSDTIERVSEIVSKREELSKEEKESVATQVGVAAVKFSVLKQSPGKNVVYDRAKAISFEGNSGPYLQYTYARCRSLIEKALSHGLSGEPMNFPEGTFVPERHLHRFPEILQKSVDELSPHAVANYLLLLAGDFNAFYGSEQIIDRDDPHSPYKIALTEAVAKILKKGLHVLGIEAPERI